MKYNNKWSDRRTGEGLLKPTLFLILEIVLYILIVALVNAFGIPVLTILSGFVVLYFFIVSTLPRFRKAYYRQKYSKYK